MYFRKINNKTIRHQNHPISYYFMQSFNCH